MIGSDLFSIPTKDLEDIGKIVYPRLSRTPNIEDAPTSIFAQDGEILTLPSHNHPSRWLFAVSLFTLAYFKIILDESEQPELPLQVAQHWLKIKVSIRNMQSQ